MNKHNNLLIIDSKYVVKLYELINKLSPLGGKMAKTES